MKRFVRSMGLLVSLLSTALTSGCSTERAEHDASPTDVPAASLEGSTPVLEFGEGARVFLSDASLSSFLSQQIPRSWSPRVNPERWHGGVDVFERVAPATVVVRAGNGHGTGFIINEDGLVLTNHHVIAHGTSVDVAEAASFAEVHLGELTREGRMELVEQPFRAFILAIDPTRDLALLELDGVSDSWRPLPTVPFAAANPRPGEICLIIGHPSSGLLWSLRQGSIAGLGESPRDLVNVLLPMLASAQDERARIEEMLEASDSCEIVLSTCLANPGDSGGPLVDEAGELIGVTFAIPREAAEQKFTYHIALDEVLHFLDQAERARLLLAPDAWAIGPMFELLDPQVLAGGVGRPIQLLLDLDGDTERQLIDDENFAALVGQRRFDPEVVVHYEPVPTAFYDSDNDGAIDEILVYSERPAVADLRFRLGLDGQWSVDSDATVPWLDPAVLEDDSLHRALKRIAKEFGLS